MPFNGEKKPIQQQTVYVQASEGSYNHQAISKLDALEGQHKNKYHFSGTPLNTFEQAAKTGNSAFVALRNDIISGNLVPATVEAFKYYRATQVSGGVNLPIELCLLRTRQSLKKGTPLTTIASHPAALAQVGHWKANRQLKELPLPEGTAAAARDLANGKLPNNTAAIGACMLTQLYPELTVVEKGIQDTDNNHTLFGRFKVSKREHPLSDAEAKQALADVIEQVKKQTPLALR